MTAAVVSVVCILLGYVAGRLHGKAAHHRFLTDGFHYLADLTRSRQPQNTSYFGAVVSEYDVLRAFGSMRDQR